FSSTLFERATRASALRLACPATSHQDLADLVGRCAGVHRHSGEAIPHDSQAAGHSTVVPAAVAQRAVAGMRYSAVQLNVHAVLFVLHIAVRRLATALAPP